MMQAIYTHGGDLDGLVSAAIAASVYPEAEVVPLGYEELERITEFPCIVTRETASAQRHGEHRDDGV